MPPPKTETQKLASRLARGEAKGTSPKEMVAFRPTAEQRHMVMVFSSNGAKRALMAEALNINIKTLDKYFYHEMQRGKEHVTMRIGAVVVREALAGNISAARYWLNSHGGLDWRVPRDRDDGQDYNDDVRRPSEQAVQFYLPQNGRDQPEQITIDVEPDDDKEKAA
jgi:hypothetical protein